MSLDDLQAQLRGTLDQQFAALNKKYEDGIADARREAAAEAERELVARFAAARAEWESRAQSSIAAARADWESQLHASVAAARAELQELANQALERQREEHTQAVERERAEYAQQIERQQSEHAQAVERERLDFAQQIERQRAEHGQSLDQAVMQAVEHAVTQAVGAARAEVQQQASQAIERQRAEYAQVLERERAEHAQTLDQAVAQAVAAAGRTAELERERAERAQQIEREQAEHAQAVDQAVAQAVAAARRTAELELESERRRGLNEVAAARQQAKTEADAARQQSHGVSEVERQQLKGALEAERQRAAGEMDALRQRMQAETEALRQRMQAEIAAARQAAAAAAAKSAAAPASAPAPAPAPALQAVAFDRPLAAIREIDGAQTLSQALDLLLAHAGAAAGRAALFLINADRLKAWKASGIPDVDVQTVESSVGGKDLLGRAIQAGQATPSGGAVPAPPFARLPADRVGLAVPLMIGGRAVAVLYADSGAGAPPAGWAQIVEALVRHTAAIVALRTAMRTLDVLGGADEGGDPATGEVRDDQGARRYARLLVSEIKLYNEAAVRTGRQQRDLLERLRPEIDRAQRLYEERVPPAVGGRQAYFHQELVQTLAEGDPALLGNS